MLRYAMKHAHIAYGHALDDHMPADEDVKRLAALVKVKRSDDRARQTVEQWLRQLGIDIRKTAANFRGLSKDRSSPFYADAAKKCQKTGVDFGG